MTQQYSTYSSDVFLMEADGTPKRVPGFEPLDMSISADGYLHLGLARYAVAANDRETYPYLGRKGTLADFMTGKVKYGKQD